jgi:Asp-tRNA(Asn)/Glu-tRNA(Gln) amidotransferase A subunit family amidase
MLGKTTVYFIAALTAIVFFVFGKWYAHYFDFDAINSESIEVAAKIIGLDFTESEHDSMIQNLTEQREQYKAIRNEKLENNIPPAIQFNPIPLGFNFEKGTGSLSIKDYSAVKRPDDMDELAFFSIGQLAHLIKSRQLTSVELTLFFLERLKRIGPDLESVITITDNLALEEAKRADRELDEGIYRGILHGIPYGVKDLLAVKGYKTTWGAMPYKDQVIDEDAAVVTKLKEAGAVLVAKLTMGALAWGDVWYGGKTRNPWNLEQGSSGSSAGSASSVAAGLLPFAIGTETWGSIVSPSTVCGATGIRPTYGRVSRTGAMALSWTMDKIGAICRSAEDCAIVFDAIKGPDGKDQTLYDVPFTYESNLDLTSLKIGYLKQDFESDYDFKANDSLALNTFKSLGIKLIPVELPFKDVDNLSFILSAEAAAAFDHLTLSNEDDQLVRQVRNAWPNVFRSSRFIPAVEYINANRLRYQLIQQMAELMNKVDCYLAPSWQGNNLLLTNLSGHPCVVFPNGFSDKNTPTSMTIIGKLFDEGTILALAQNFQDVTDFNKKHPEVE